ncbi:hypothetical protein D3C73_1155790 [compost metagenome]
MTAMVHGLANAQGNGHQVGNQRGPEAEGNGHRHFLQDQVGDRGTPEEALAEIQLRVALEHQPQAFRRRFVEAVLSFDFLDQLRVEAATGTRGAAGHVAGPAADTGATDALQVRDGLFHRAAGRGLDNDEVDQKDNHQRRDDQQQAPQNVSPHQCGPPGWPRLISSAVICWLVNGVVLTSHQLSMASSFAACTLGMPKRFHHTVELPGG